MMKLMHKGIVPKQGSMESSSMLPSPKMETRDRDAVDSQQRQTIIMIVIGDCYLCFCQLCDFEMDEDGLTHTDTMKKWAVSRKL